jgi:hypothetical protein
MWHEQTSRRHLSICRLCGIPDLVRQQTNPTIACEFGCGRTSTPNRNSSENCNSIELNFERSGKSSAKTRACDPHSKQRSPVTEQPVLSQLLSSAQALGPSPLPRQSAARGPLT